MGASRLRSGDEIIAGQGEGDDGDRATDDAGGKPAGQDRAGEAPGDRGHGHHGGMRPGDVVPAHERAGREKRGGRAVDHHAEHVLDAIEPVEVTEPEEADGTVVIESSDSVTPLLGWLATLPLDEVQIEPIGLGVVYDRFHGRTKSG